MDSFLFNFKTSTSKNWLATLNKGLLHTTMRFALIAFLAIAGSYHFIDPSFYYPLIPDYLPFHKTLNYSLGTLELIIAILYVFKRTRQLGLGIYGILLLLFIPSHMHFIKLGACIPEGLCTPIWLAWVRLIVIHPLLFWWAFVAAKNRKV